MHWETADGRYRIYVVRIDDTAQYRLMSFPGGYWRGDYRSIAELLRAHDSLDLADFEQVEPS